VRQELINQFEKRGLVFEGDKKASGKSGAGGSVAASVEHAQHTSATDPFEDDVASMGFTQPTVAMATPEHPIRSGLEVKYMELDVISQSVGEPVQSAHANAAEALATQGTIITTTSLHATEAKVVVLHEASTPAAGAQDLTMTAAKAQIASFTPHMTIMKTSQATGPWRYKLKIRPELYEDLVCGYCGIVLRKRVSQLYHECFSVSSAFLSWRSRRRHHVS
jgi:hypothetical protein